MLHTGDLKGEPDRSSLSEAVFPDPLIDHVDQALEGPGEVLVLVVDQVEFPRHGRICEGYCLESSHVDLLADHPSRDDGDAQSFLHGGLDGLVVGKFQRDGNADVVPPDEILGASSGRRSLFVDNKGMSGKIPRLDERFCRKGMSRGDDDLVAVL